MRYLSLFGVALFSAANLTAVEIGSVSFTPTHVWSGGAGTTAFATQGNWQDANGDPVAADLNKGAVRCFCTAEYDGGARHAFTTCQPDLDAFPTGQMTDDGSETRLEKNHPFDRDMRLLYHFMDVKLDDLHARPQQFVIFRTQSF